MAQWYIKELSKLTKVSVQTLHHYDRVNLLKPSLRLANGYRLYSENDLLKLQQIIALKCFNFSLSQIKALLSEPLDLIDHFKIQSSLLEKKAKSLFEASQTLKTIIADSNQKNAIPWETIIHLIEVYRMTQAIEENWKGKTLTPEEIKDYVSFEQDIKSKFSEKEKRNFKKAWDDLVKEVNANLKKDPQSPLGIELGGRCMAWVNHYYGKKYASLRITIWDKGIKDGYLSSEVGLSKEGGHWLDQAIEAYAKERITNFFSQIESYPEKTLLKQWEKILSDYFGDDKDKKNEFCLMLLNDPKVPEVAKNWLKDFSQRAED